MRGTRIQKNLTSLSSGGIRMSQLFKIQPRKSSLRVGDIDSKNVWQRSSAGGNAFHLPRISGLRASEDASGLGLVLNSDHEAKSQRTSTATSAMAKRVIWLVCEDCGASKRIVEPVGDPGMYFYDGDEIRDGEDKTVKVGLKRPASPSTQSSVDAGMDASIADVGLVVDKRRFALVNAEVAGVVEIHE